MGAEQSMHNEDQLQEYVEDLIEGQWQCVGFDGDMITLMAALGHKVESDDAHFGLRNRRIKVAFTDESVAFNILLSNGLEVTQIVRIDHADTNGVVAKWIGNALEIKCTKRKSDPRRVYYRNGDSLICEVFTETGLSVRQNYRKASKRKNTVARLQMWA
jgi:hypothetical protein|mmetsp:Transcript_60806/g.96495  ORF Transcript_60806/g.96495 Transcript_60806/m.96495 type:complete len:159 (-) Transcript_60806:498-974(-)